MTHPPANPAPRPRESLLAGVVIAVAVVLAYANTFAVPFLLDDDSSIRDNPSLRSLATAWSPPSDGGLTVSGRPFLNFTLALNYLAGGTAVRGYHWVNLLIHAAAGCTLFGIVRRTLLRPRLAPRFGPDATWLALGVALLWTLHPLQTQAVTYIVQRAESLVSLMYLLTFWCFIRAVEFRAARAGASAWNRWSVAAVIACLLGMASKEVMVTAPVMIALYDRVFVGGSWREAWRQRGGLHLALASTWLLLAWLVLGTGGRGGTAGFGGDVSPAAYALTQVDAVVHYLRLALWPHPLVFDYGMRLVKSWGEIGGQALVLAVLGGASLWAAWRGRAAGYLGVFFLGVLAPSSSFVPVFTQTMSEHRVYLALAAVVTLGVTGLYARAGRWSFALLAVAAVALGAATVRRNQDYRTELALWEDTVVKRPANFRALAALAAVHQAAGRHEEARVLLEETVRLVPRSPEAHNNLGNAWMKLGRWSDAEASFREALRLKPDNAYTLNNLGNALLQLGRAAEAVPSFEAALRLRADFAEARYNLANTLAELGRYEAAAAEYVELLRRYPRDAEARSNYASVLMALRRTPEAIEEMTRVIALQPGVAELHNNLGVALAQAGRMEEALREFREAVRLNPGYDKARENAARAARDLGEP